MNTVHNEFHPRYFSRMVDLSHSLSNLHMQGMGLLLLLQGIGLLMLLQGVGKRTEVLLIMIQGMGVLLMLQGMGVLLLMKGMGVLLLLNGMGVQLVAQDFLAELKRGKMEPYAYIHSFFTIKLIHVYYSYFI